MAGPNTITGPILRGSGAINFLLVYICDICKLGAVEVVDWRDLEESGEIVGEVEEEEE